MSTNVSKEKRNLLIKKIEDIKTFIQSSPQDDNTAQLLTYISDIEKDIKGKKYGLVFEEHREGIDEVLENNLPVLTEDADLFIDNGGQMNFLIEGDNLASLKLLEKTHKGRIDLIYIDPPYNTGKKDFVYDDKCVDSTDLFSHSKWLSFMSKRLQSAKNILSEKGVIFISIDDNEQATLKILCDEIFGANNFLACVCVKGNPRGRQSSTYFAQVHDSLLVYRKTDKAELMGFDISDEEIQKRFNKVNENGVPYEEWELRKRGADSRREDSPNLWFPIYYNAICGISTVKIAEEDIVIVPKLSDGSDGRWRWSKEKVEKDKERLYVRKTNKGVYNIYERKYLEEKSKQLAPTIWDYPEVNTELGTKILKSILGGVSEFDFPKPIGLINRILSMLPNNIVILDFFAGSGTTGHAVMKLNAEDGGQRKFILCTNNENNICRDVTYERIKRVIAKEDYKASLKYFKVEYLPISDKLYYEYADELLLHIRELVELENGINFNGNAEIAIVLTEKELDDFTQNIPETCKAIYVGHNVLPTEEQENIFAKRKIKVNVIPEYYYRDLEG